MTTPPRRAQRRRPPRTILICTWTPRPRTDASPGARPPIHGRTGEYNKPDRLGKLGPGLNRGAGGVGGAFGIAQSGGVKAAAAVSGRGGAAPAGEREGAAHQVGSVVPLIDGRGGGGGIDPAVGYVRRSGCRKPGMTHRGREAPARRVDAHDASVMGTRGCRPLPGPAGADQVSRSACFADLHWTRPFVVQTLVRTVRGFSESVRNDGRPSVIGCAVRLGRADGAVLTRAFGACGAEYLSYDF